MMSYKRYSAMLLSTQAWLLFIINCNRPCTTNAAWCLPCLTNSSKVNFPSQDFGKYALLCVRPKTITQKVSAEMLFCSGTMYSDLNKHLIVLKYCGDIWNNKHKYNRKLVWTAAFMSSAVQVLVINEYLPITHKKKYM